MLSSIAETLFGISLLYVGADLLVKNAARMALSFGMHPLVVGMTIVAFSTSSPELLTTCFAQWNGHEGDLALGNILGSSSANIGLILGLAALLKPMHLTHELKRRDLPIMVLGSSLLGILLLFGSISRQMGLLLISIFALTTLYQIYTGKKAKIAVDLPEKPSEIPKGRNRKIAFELFWTLVSIAFLAIGAKILLSGATSLASLFGLSERVTGLTLVAVGGSLPELAATLIAAHKKHAEIAIGNIVGSNLFNNLLITGAASLIRPIDFSPSLLLIDFPVMMAFTLLFWIAAGPRHDISRPWGASFLLLYSAYIGFFVF